MKKWLFLSLLVVSSIAQAQNMPPPSPDEAQPSAPAQASAPSATEQSQSSESSGVPSYFRPDPVSFNVKLGAGMAFGPDAFWMTGDVEAQLDKFVALGPKIQWGNSSSTDFIFGSFGPRFTLPIQFFELGFQGGLGFAYRNVLGFEFVNFLYQANFNLDFYLLKNFSMGINYTTNFISSQADEFMSALTLGLSGHF